MKKLGILSLAVLVFGLVGAVWLINRNQEMRRGATYSGVGVSFVPNIKALTIGETFTATVMMDGKTSKLSGVDLKIHFDSDKLRVLGTRVVTSTSPGIGAGGALLKDETGILEVGVTSGIVKMAAVSMEEDETRIPAGAVQLMKIDFEAIAGGQARVGFWTADGNVVVGHNTNSGDKGLALTDIADGIYTISGGTDTATPTPTVTPIPGSEPVLHFKMSYSGTSVIAPGSTESCANGWTVGLVVLGGGKTAIYNGLQPTIDSVVNDRIIYRVDKTLTGFDARENVAVFVKGPSHLQMKYGVDNQASQYGAPGGELMLNDDSKVFNFSQYPLLGGDVTGADNLPDGRIDSVDFGAVKSASQAQRSTTGFERMDLDGNCQLGPQDAEILKQSLSVKQDELY